MTTKLQVYPKYKDSSIEWIKTIPVDWYHDKIVSLFNFPNDKVNDVDFEPLSVTYGGVKKQVEDAAKTDNGSNRKLLKIGDIAFNGRSDRRGACGVSEFDGSISIVYHVLRKKTSNVYARYYHHLFRNTLFSQEFYRWGRGIHDDMWTTRTLEMKHIQVPVPPIETQKRIADFLDKKTRIIDELVAKKEKMIELLHEKRTALITRTVTKGLDSKTKRKPSGVDWLGDIPEAWITQRLKFCLRLISKNGSDEPKSSENTIALENIEGWTGCYKETDSNYEGGTEFRKNDVLFGKLRPYLAKVFLAQDSGKAIGDILVYRAKEAIAPKFSFYFLLSDGFIDVINSSTFGSKMPRAESSFIGNLMFTFPNTTEQKLIVDFLDQETVKIDKNIPLIYSQINQLQEYRSSLIYSAVTGKIKI